MFYVNVDRDGDINFDSIAGLRGTLMCGMHEDIEILRAAVSAISRKTYDGESWICSGVRDAGDNDNNAYRAAVEYRNRLKQSIQDAEQDVTEEAN